jgi:2-polyprenyl-3-methyl-5-hydroxy-6-metoxy-1,4-benzoquinol methylase
MPGKYRVQVNTLIPTTGALMTKEVIQFWEEHAHDYREHAYKFDPKSDRYPFFEVRLNLMLDMVRDLPKGRLLDAGCGGGSILIRFLQTGWEGCGVDGAKNMVALANQNLASAGFADHRVTHASVTDLSQFPTGSFDLIISAGVMEYLTPEEEKLAFAEAHRVLKPGGHFLIENINGLFDISTFNRFTVNFFAERVLPLFFAEAEKRAELTKKIEGLVTNPTKPARAGTYVTTRDQVYTKAEIPLEYGRKVKKLGFSELEQGFYRFHAVPPLLFEGERTLEHAPIEHELKLSRHWIGNFIASGFVSLLKRLDKETIR